MIYMSKLMSYKKCINNLRFYFIPILVLLDFLSKLFFTSILEWKKILIFGEYVFFEIFKNKWIAFSIELPLLKVITLIVILLIVWYYLKYEKKKNNTILDISFIFIISWALWNARERIFLWEVTDFIWVKNFSVFNFADIYINLWLIIYLIIVLKKGKQWL